MKKSLLQLDDLNFRKILVEAQPNQSDVSETIVTDSVELFQNKEDPKIWGVELKLKIQGADQHSVPPYVGEITVFGSFRIEAGISEIASINLIRVNGTSILYSAAREMFSNLTARGPNRMVILPAKTFIDLKLPEPEVADEETRKENPRELKNEKLNI